MSVARTGLPHPSRTPPATQSAPGIAGVALDRTPSGNGHRTPATVVPAALQDRTTVADPDTAAAPDARSRCERWSPANAQAAPP